MKRDKTRFILVLIWTVFLIAEEDVAGFEVLTHRDLNRSAAQRLPGFDEFLRENVALAKGLTTNVNGKQIVAWIGEGGIREDDHPRYFNHFHTPLREWDQAGFSVFDASVRWAQREGQFPGGLASWADGRRSFLRGLKASRAPERESALAETFEILGNLMHLVSDLGSIAHTRKDPHPTGDDFEAYMDIPANRGLIAGIQPETFSGTLLTIPLPAGESIATVPIARIWDSDRYSGSNPNDTVSTELGLAEFASTNFFSQDSISATTQTDADIPYPALDRLRTGPLMNGTQYLSKDGDGIPITLMVAEGLFVRDFAGVPFLVNHILDDAVFAEYAANVLPRTIGYSAGLLDYFFRGRIDLTLDANNPDPYLIRNLSSEDMTGAFSVYYDDFFGERKSLAATGTVHLPAQSSRPIQLDPPNDAAVPGEYTLVFEGRLGLEENAVVGRVNARLVPPGGTIITAGGDAVGFAPAGNGGAVVVEVGAPSLDGLPGLPLEELFIPSGEERQQAGGVYTYSKITIAGTLRLDGDTTLISQSSVTIGGAVYGLRDERNGADLILQAQGPIDVFGRIETSGVNGVQFSGDTVPGGEGGSVSIISASTAPFNVPTIVTRGGDAHLTDTRNATTTFTGGGGGDITVVSHGVEIAFSGDTLPDTAVDTLPPQTHIAPSRTNFRRGLLSTGGYGGIFGGALGGVAAGGTGGAGGTIEINCIDPSPIRFENSQLFTGGNIDTNLGYTTFLVRNRGESPSSVVFIQPTGSLGGRGSTGAGVADGGSGGIGGRGGDVLLNPNCSLVPFPASFVTPAATARFRRSGSDPRQFAVFDRLPIIEALDDTGARLFALQAFGGGAGIPGGSAKTSGHCSVTGAQCFTNDASTCPPAPQSQICIGDTAGDPGRFGTQGQSGAISCDELLIPAGLRTGLVCQ